MSTLEKKYKTEIRDQMMKKFKYTNISMIPKIEKIIIHRGLGEATGNSKCIDISVNTLMAITGSKPILTKSKKAISNFKLRENQVIGCKVSLRHKKMHDFLTKLINIALPKIRDFRGLPDKSYDKDGNYTFGLKEDLIFPEVDYDKLDKTRGMDITIVTTCKTREESHYLLQCYGLPFIKRAENVEAKEVGNQTS